MGWRFELKYANVVAYLTVPEEKRPPRLSAWELREFLGALQGEYRARPPIFSADKQWVLQILQVAMLASKRLDTHNLDQDTVVPTNVAEYLLSDLRIALGRFDFYGLPVGRPEDTERLHAFAEHAAYSSEHYGLFLIPEFRGAGDTLEVFDPSSVMKTILTHADSWPGVLFWNRFGTTAFTPLNEADRLYAQLLEAARHGRNEGTSWTLQDFNSRHENSGVKRLLHLSDLHFGTSQALSKQTYLLGHLRGKLDRFQRIVVTGDLFDNPKESDALAFQNFRAEIEAWSGKKLIVIPGNHDQKTHGNTFLGFGRRLKELTKLEWTSLAIDDEMQCAFFCFDSSRDAPDFARGRVTKQQMVDVATAFEGELLMKPRIKDYLSVALIHHHPYSFNTRTETPLGKGLRLFGISDETFLKMDGSHEFLEWCVGRRIPLILHGHKHVPRHVRDHITWPPGKGSRVKEITAVGCGTSLGIEGLPLSYNVLEWSPKSKMWSASFFSDPGSGAGFEEIYVSLQSHSA